MATFLNRVHRLEVEIGVRSSASRMLMNVWYSSPSWRIFTNLLQINIWATLAGEIVSPWNIELNGACHLDSFSINLQYWFNLLNSIPPAIQTIPPRRDSGFYPAYRQTGMTGLPPVSMCYPSLGTLECCGLTPQPSINTFNASQASPASVSNSNRASLDWCLCNRLRVRRSAWKLAVYLSLFFAEKRLLWNNNSSASRCPARIERFSYLAQVPDWFPQCNRRIPRTSHQSFDWCGLSPP